MKRTIMVIASMVFWTGWYLWKRVCRIAGKKFSGTCVVLYYHSVTRNQRIRFARQMDELIRRTKPIRVDLKDSLQPGVHHAAVTFDDGFRSVVENALPELIERSIPSTMFIPTGLLGQPAQWDIGPDSRDNDEIVMTADQVKELPSDLVDIGSHTVTHCKLTVVDQREAYRELCDSRQELESISGRDIRLLSFPYGEYDEKIVALSRKMGYERVFTIIPTLAFSKGGEYVTGRVLVTPADWRLEFRLKLLGAYCWLPFAFSLKHKLLRLRPMRSSPTKGGRHTV